jgi:hypothetical protein
MQAFQVTKTEAPAEWAHIQVVGWVELTDEVGTKAVGALESRGQIIIPHGSLYAGYSLTSNDCRETIAAAQELFS